MSRKSNNLKKRLRIVESQLASQKKHNGVPWTELLAVKAERDEAIRKQKFDDSVRSMLVEVERDPATRHMDTYAAMVRFQPDAFLRMRFRDRYPVNVNMDIDMMAREISRQVERQIRECFRQVAEKSHMLAGALP